MRLSAKIMGSIAVLSIAMLALAACGGGGNGGSSEGGNGGNGGDGAIVVEMGPGFVFKPSEITVTKGEKVVLEVVNKDSTPHSFVIEELGVNSGEVAANESTTLEFTPEEAGEVEIICDVPGHAEGVMVGKLIVNE